MVSKLLTFITGRLNPGNIDSTHGLKQSSNQLSKQDDQTFISIYIDYLKYHYYLNLK